MAMFKAAATYQLQQLMAAFLLANSYRALLPRNLPNACGSEVYLRLDLSHDRLVTTTLYAALLLFWVRTVVDITEANVVAAARAATGAGAKTFDYDAEVAAAASKGIGSIAAGWKRLFLRALLLLAVGVSVAASFHAVMVFEDGFLYRTGCADDVDADAWTGPGSPTAVALMSVMAYLHGVFAWAAVSKN